MPPERLRLPLTLVTAVAVAEAATLLLRPRDTGPAPAPVEARAYFRPEQLARARAFRRGQRRLAAAAAATELGVLAAAVGRPARALRDPGRPVAAGAAAGAVLSAALTLAPLPARALARRRARDVGLVTDTWGSWAKDVAKSTTIGGGLAAGGGALFVLAQRRFGPRWWIPGSAGAVTFAVVGSTVAPVLLEPLFNRFTRLPEGELRSEVLALAERAGVRVGEVFTVDASRRTTAVNAYVNGLGRTKRVVLFDTLLRDLAPAEVRSVVAHELAHVRFRDVPRGLLWAALATPTALLAMAELTARLTPRDAAPGPAALPALALSAALVAPALNVVANGLSRAVERRADAFALRATDDPEALIALHARLAVQNVVEPSPPRLARLLLGTHPTTLERIGAAVAFRNGEARLPTPEGP